MDETTISSVTTTPSRSLYDTDFYGWLQVQTALLRQSQWHQLDLPNLIEEIESLGKKQRQELRNRLSVLVGHLLKWEFQPQNRSRSWMATIRIQRLDISDLLEESPSLRPYLEEALQKAHRKGVILAVKDTDLPESTFPSTCPYRLMDILDDRFYPGEPSNLVSESN